jgi:hypothetical protein
MSARLEEDEAGRARAIAGVKTETDRELRRRALSLDQKSDFFFYALCPGMEGVYFFVKLNVSIINL